MEVNARYVTLAAGLIQGKDDYQDKLKVVSLHSVFCFHRCKRFLLDYNSPSPKKKR